MRTGRGGSKNQINKKHQILPDFDEFISYQQPANSLTDQELRGGDPDSDPASSLRATQGSEMD